MKSRIKRWLCGTLPLLAAISAACTPSDKAEYVQVKGLALGTFVYINARTTHPAAEIARQVERIDSLAKASMSIFDDESLLSRVNRNQTDSLDEHIIFNIELARRFSELSRGRYDITVKPLVEAWGFVRKQPDPDSEPNIDSLLQFVGYDKIRIENGRLVKEDPRIQLDFNSIAKGYVVDMMAEMLERDMQSTDYIVDIGGEVRCKGCNERGERWRIGIETPYDGNDSMEDIQRVISITDAGVATSGNYRRYWTDSEGRKVAHTIDPVTGRSAVSQLLSVTVVAPTCAEADAAGTMLLAMGSDGAVELAEQCDDLLCYFIFAGDGDEEYRVVCSEGLRQMLTE
ncbi:MAG: FAD:protein FMN transferase [Alistipes sp.]|nr:FAD:protein FMN transferase [Alistipes sp.]